MADAIEQLVEATLVEARAAVEAAEEQLAVAQGKVDEMLAQARGNRAECLDELKRIEKTLKVYRGEPLVKQSKASNNGSETNLSEELLVEVYSEATQRAVESDDGGFTIHAVAKNLDGVGYDTVKAAFEQLRHDGPKGEPPKIRKAGKRTGGTKYMLWDRPS